MTTTTTITKKTALACAIDLAQGGNLAQVCEDYEVTGEELVSKLKGMFAVESKPRKRAKVESKASRFNRAAADKLAGMVAVGDSVTIAQVIDLLHEPEVQTAQKASAIMTIAMRNGAFRKGVRVDDKETYERC